MTASLDQQKLAKLCGLFGSDHIGERAAAAQMADRLVKASGLSWFDVISARSTSIDLTADKIAFALANICVLPMWERGFIYGVNSQRKPLSDRQLTILDQIVAKAEACARAA